MTVSTLFDGTDDRIASSTGNDLTLGAYTWGALLHLEGITGLDTWFSMDDGGVARFSPFTSGTTLGIEHAVGTSSQLAAAFADWGGWRAVFITKATGTVAPRAHIYNGVSWVHTNMATAIGNPNGAQSLLWLGGYATGASDFSDGEMGWCGLWGQDTAVDATVESYLDYDTLAAKGNQEFFTGTSLLNGGTMDDISARNNNETTRTGATTGVRDLPGWMLNFHTRDLPCIVSSNEFVGTTGNPTYAAPSGAVAGDLIIVNGVLDSTVASSPSAGWATLVDTTVSTTNRCLVYARVLDGSGSDTLTITLTANTNDFAFQSHRVVRHGVVSPSTHIEVATPATNTSSATPDPPSHSWASGNRFVMCGYGADDDDTSNAFMPANYAGLRLTRSATGTSSCSTGSAYREIRGATSENPGTFTMAAAEEWVAWTISIPPMRPWARNPVNPRALWVPRGRNRTRRSR